MSEQYTGVRENSIAPVSPGTAPRPCPSCGVIDRPTVGEGSGPHTASLRCAHCGHWLQWHSTRTPAARQQALAARPPTAAQLDYLTALGGTGPAPATMLEASERIDGLLRRGEVHP